MYGCTLCFNKPSQYINICLFFSELFGLTGELVVKGKGELTTKNNTRICLLAVTAQTDIINLMEIYVYKHKQFNNQIDQQVSVGEQ